MFIKLYGTISAFVCGVIIVSTLLCERATDVGRVEKCSDVEVEVVVADGLGKTAKTDETGFDSLIIEVSGSDMETMRFSSPRKTGELVLRDTLRDIPAGSKRLITVSTINRLGGIVHRDSVGSRPVVIEPGIMAFVQVVLVPVCASVCLQLVAVPTDVDSVGVAFIADDELWSRTVARQLKVFICLDNIPDNTSGRFLVSGYTVGGDTLYSAETTLIVYADSLREVMVSFTGDPGGLGVSAVIRRPGVTVVSGSMGGAEVTERERCGVIITEIMYAANDSEYIEILNPGEEDLLFDSLIIEVDARRSLFHNVSIEARGRYVFGRRPLPWVDASPAATGALDLSSNGNWITVRSKDGAVMDRVIFSGANAGMEWPKVSGKASICLKEQIANCSDNNFGRGWIAATTPIDGAPGHMGTPHD